MTTDPPYLAQDATSLPPSRATRCQPPARAGRSIASILCLCVAWHDCRDRVTDQLGIDAHCHEHSDA